MASSTVGPQGATPTAGARTGAVGGPGAISVAARLDRIPPFGLHRRMGVAVGFGNFFDLYDIFLGGVLAAVLAESWGLGTSGKALVIASGFGGMFVGASTLGALADRIGRRRTFLLEILIYSVFTLAAAFSPNLAVLAILRFCAGIGLGGELSLADTYLSEILPKQVRGRYMAWAYTLSFFGVPLAAFIGAKFVANHDLLFAGWRWLLIVGSLGALVIFALRRSLPESPRWHENRGDHEAADRCARVIEDAAREELGIDELPEPEPIPPLAPQRSSVSEILEGPYRRRSLMLWVFQFLQTVGYYGFGTLAPLVLADKGYDIVDTLGFTAVIYLGYPVGSALSIPLMERFERKHLIIASALGIGACGLVFGFARAEWLILIAGWATTASSNVFSNSFHIYQAEIFPTRIRATAVGTAYSLSRLSGAILPFITVTVLDDLGATAVFLGAAAIMILLSLDIGLFGPRSTGMKLEDSAAEEAGAAEEAPRFSRAASVT